ncbi:peptidylprolyl isomerase [Nocardioides dongxiaopingii]|uniref:peptidylprolyl isomerase n=1 Tax=Nocardioides sp. S-1144 TaxID=2582905 RepID=UPI00110E8D2E|nr:peptidylprolyl isomerase [Nocardioides sp. S-1144]QCW50762.1 peptidylprolyl isomerase [Nocardioides sp. S-1144]
MVKRSLARPGSLLAAVVLVLGLAGCGDESGSPDEGSSPSASASEGADDSTGAEARTHEPQPENAEGAPCTYTTGSEAARAVEPPPAAAAYTGTVEVVLETSAGDVDATLDAQAAPCTVNSFTSLASQGYYDDTPCHRLTTQGIYVLQCGDPTGTGSGGPGYSFADELTGSETYPAGTLAMANAGPNTNGSQFFVVYDETPLPPSYTVFGTIGADGLAVVQSIADRGTDDGSGDGAPAEEVTLDFVAVGEAVDGPPAAVPSGTCTYPSDGSGTTSSVQPPPARPSADGDVAITIASTIGRLRATLDAAAAPCTVNSFTALAEQGFFDGTSCHRLTTQGIFVLQCGDPTGTGSGGPGYSFADELSGSETYPAGTLAMANAGADTNGSQFFIVYGDSELPPSYTVFGTVSPATLKAVTRVGDAGVRGGGPDGAPKTAVTLQKVTVG